MSTFHEEDEYQDDTASVEDVYEVPDQGPAVPVRLVESTLAVDQRPTQLGRCFNVIMGDAANAQLILNREPRRCRAIIWAYPLGTGATGVAIGGTQAEAQQVTGALLFSLNAITRYEFTSQNELWARPVLVSSTSGTWTAYASTTDNLILSVVEELWTR